MFRDRAPPGHPADPLVRELAIPRLVEEEDADAGARERLRDDDVVLAEGVEAQLLGEARLVLGRAARVVAAARPVRVEVAHGLEVDGLGVSEDPLFAEPGLRRHSPPLRASRPNALDVSGLDPSLQ